MIRLIAALYLALGVTWHAMSPGVRLREEPFAASGALANVHAIVVHVDPQRHRVRLDLARSQEGRRAAWVVDSMPPDAVVAFNAGQFTGGFPWGWLVRDNVEYQR